MSRDADAARAFYEELLGWEWDEIEMGDQGTYGVIMNAGRPNGGVMRMTDEWPEHTPSHWMVYIGSDDVDADAARVKAAGGTIHVEPSDIPVGRFCVTADPTGAPFSIFEGGEM
ncbi:MAG: VOC family protein [Longimicrobiales bacterium]|nr:VOC family protein [Longimicrobiales bacterium]